MKKQGALGIVVTDYHTPTELTGFVESLRSAQVSIPYAVCIEVVEGTAEEKAAAEAFAALLAQSAIATQVVCHSQNVGYNRATNDGVEWLALYDEIDTYAVFNSDCRLRPGVLESCSALLAADERYGVCGPRQIDELGRLTHGGIFGTPSSPQHRGWHRAPLPGEYQDVRDDAVTVSGAAYFVRRSVWEELSLCPIYRSVDPTARGAFLQCHHYFGETYASYHAVAHGYRCVYNGAATMVHGWHKSSPVGGIGEQNWVRDQGFFRRACDAHGIAHD